jgi:hypothetical protein
LALKAK